MNSKLHWFLTSSSAYALTIAIPILVAIIIIIPVYIMPEHDLRHNDKTLMHTKSELIQRCYVMGRDNRTIVDDIFCQKYLHIHKLYKEDKKHD